MKNVCFFNSVKFWGGGEKLHLEYAVEFQKKGYQTMLFAGKSSPLSARAEEHHLPVHPVSIGNLSFLNPFKIVQLIRLYRKHKVDTVIFSVSQDLKAGGIAAKLAGVKNIVYLRGLAVPIKASLINRIIFKSVLTHIVANSDATKKQILKHLGRYIPADRVKTIYHGIDLELKTEVSRTLGIITQKGKGIILGNAGRLTPQKGQQHLVEVAKKLKEKGLKFTLFIAGTGEMQDELQSLIQENDLGDEVILLGFVKDMEAFMNSIDIFLLSSLWEGFGYVLVEAMIKSKPAVAFNISSNPEIVLANQTGFLVDYPHIEKFADRVEELIVNEKLRQQLGEAARKSVVERFDLKERITEFENAILGPL